MTLVVDACILRSAGTSGKPVPSECRAILEEIKVSSITVSICDDLLAEWRRHKSNYSSAWLVAMYSRRLINKVNGFSGKADSVESAISKLAEPDRTVALKDVHLLKVAVDHGYRVVSNERKCRMAFHNASAHYQEIGRVSWIFPAAPMACDVVAGRCVAPGAWRLSIA